MAVKRHVSTLPSYQNCPKLPKAGFPPLNVRAAAEPPAAMPANFWFWIGGRVRNPLRCRLPEALEHLRLSDCWIVFRNNKE